MVTNPTPQPTPSAPTPSENKGWACSLRIMAMPRDTNQYGTIFGGVILSAIDQAAFVEARRHGVHRWVTASVDKVEFSQPVHVGDLVTCLTRTTRTGTSSATVEVRVEAERYEGGETVRVTEAQLTMVAIGPDGRPVPMDSPPTAHLPAKPPADPASAQ
ncbi:MAG: acyl-CoA thioesterase [Phycisphaera sp.]|nr:MAG: acyl-CoA thioesterase [Phycisphaera sp.]